MFHCLIILGVASIFGLNEAATNRSIPDGFLLGTASASYQIEGGWNANGKGENIWDYACHNTPSLILNGDTGDVACDSYNKYEEDVSMLVNLGVDTYRFSLSWSRILPNGFANVINNDGLQYYQNLIDLLIANNITPIITIFHWDLPQPLQLLGGWANPEIIEIFADFARIVFQQYGDKVKLWATFNEILSFCQLGYAGTKAPFYNSDGVGNYLCGHNVLKAHARAYHIFHEELNQTGRLSVVLNCDWAEPVSNSTEDLEAAERSLLFNLGWFAHPVYLGNYPQVMIDWVENKSLAQGFSHSRLPTFTQEEIDYIYGTADYFALNSYTTNMVQNVEYFVSEQPGFWTDMNVDSFKDPEWEETASEWLRVVPWGLRKLLNWIKQTYNDPEILITESGYSDKPGTINDTGRVNYYREYLSNVIEAVLDDDVNVIGYTAWSLMDNFEWERGYSERFGLYYVAFEDDNRPRTIKLSGEYYKNVTATRCLVEECVS